MLLLLLTRSSSLCAPSQRPVTVTADVELLEGPSTPVLGVHASTVGGTDA